MEEVLGNEFTWWMGVVEDRDDPLKLGRCRVRIYHWHTEDTAQLPTDKLPWAQPMCPITNGATQNIGETPLGIQVGTWVVGFFMDGQLAQKPMIMGTIAGIPGAEPDMSQLARNDSEFPHPVIDEKNNSRTQSVVTANFGSFSEPPSAYAARYPFNKVMETERGHIKEYDDTPGAERIHEYHTAGTFYEIDANGTKNTRIVGDNYEINLRNKKLFVSGDLDVVCGGAGLFGPELLGSATELGQLAGLSDITDQIAEGVNDILTATGATDALNAGLGEVGLEFTGVTGEQITELVDLALSSIGDGSISARGKDMNVIALGDVNVTAIGNITTNTLGKTTVNAQAGVDVNSIADVNVTAATDINLVSSAEIVLSSAGPMTLVSGTSIRLAAPRIDIN